MDGDREALSFSAGEANRPGDAEPEADDVGDPHPALPDLVLALEEHAALRLSSGRRGTGAEISVTGDTVVMETADEDLVVAETAGDELVDLELWVRFTRGGDLGLGENLAARGIQ